jgi:hypothetical protein
MLKWFGIVLGLVLVAALTASAALQFASDHNAAYAVSEARWVRANIVPGMTRAAAYRMLKSEGLTAFNSAFVKGRAIPATSPDPRYPLNGAGCEYPDAADGNWPYKGEYLPKQEGACALSRPTTSEANPDAYIELPGEFNMACAWRTYITVKFDESDRIRTVHVGAATPTCL